MGWRPQKKIFLRWKIYFLTGVIDNMDSGPEASDNSDEDDDSDMDR